MVSMAWGRPLQNRTSTVCSSGSSSSMSQCCGTFWSVKNSRRGVVSRTRRSLDTHTSINCSSRSFGSAWCGQAERDVRESERETHRSPGEVITHLVQHKPIAIVVETRRHDRERLHVCWQRVDLLLQVGPHLERHQPFEHAPTVGLEQRSQRVRTVEAPLGAPNLHGVPGAIERHRFRVRLVARPAVEVAGHAPRTRHAPAILTQVRGVGDPAPRVLRAPLLATHARQKLADGVAGVHVVLQGLLEDGVDRRVHGARRLAHLLVQLVVRHLALTPAVTLQLALAAQHLGTGLAARAHRARRHHLAEMPSPKTSKKGKKGNLSSSPRSQIPFQQLASHI